jgi:hypothetical protein
VALDDNEGRSATEVLEGRVAVSRERRAVPVAEGFGLVARAAAPLPPPTPLLPAPNVTDVTRRLVRVGAIVAVAPVAGAIAYRLQLSADPLFATLLVDRTEPVPSFRLPAELADGPYYLRVRAIDVNGLEGLEAALPIELDAHPEPPALISPRDRSRVRDAQPSFRWAEPTNAAAYRFRLAPASAPEVPIIVRDDLRGGRFTTEGVLAPGEYAWQVATVAANGDVGPFGDPVAFTRVEPPPVPRPEVGEASSERLVIRLPPGDEGATYHVQLARAVDFADLAFEARIAEPEVTIPHLYPARYYLRVRITEADGFEGPFSPPQRIDVRPTRWWPIFAIPAALVLLAL